MIEAGPPRCIGRPAHLPHYRTASPLVRRQCKRSNQYIQQHCSPLFECSDNHRRYCSRTLPRCSLVSPVMIFQRVSTSHPTNDPHSFPGAQIRRRQPHNLKLATRNPSHNPKRNHHPQRHHILVSIDLPRRPLQSPVPHPAQCRTVHSPPPRRLALLARQISRSRNIRTQCRARTPENALRIHAPHTRA